MAIELRQGNHKLASAPDCREAIEAAADDDPVTIERDGKLLWFRDAKGRVLGSLTNRNPAVRRLDAGDPLLHCCVAWTYGPCVQYPGGLVSVRVITGDPDDEYVKWCAREVWGKPRTPRPQDSYAANIVGESFYQEAIRNCRVADPVALYREEGNPHDAQAIVVKSSDGSVIGYVPRATWMQRVVHQDGCGLSATIKTIHPGPPMAVVLDVIITGEPLDTANYVAPTAG